MAKTYTTELRGEQYPGADGRDAKMRMPRLTNIGQPQKKAPAAGMRIGLTRSESRRGER
jgi:hypothetical protein